VSRDFAWLEHAADKIRTAPRAMMVAIRPASPKLRISSDSENSKARNETAAVAWVRTQLHLFVAIDRTSKFAFVELHEKATTKVAADFLRHLVAAVPYKIHTVLTDNGIHFTIPGGGGLTAGEIKEAKARSSVLTLSNLPARGTISIIG
jgi:glucose-6-phosphate isomerase